MSMFKLKNHRVKEASFLENFGRKKLDHMDVGVEGKKKRRKCLKEHWKWTVVICQR